MVECRSCVEDDERRKRINIFIYTVRPRRLKRIQKNEEIFGHTVYGRNRGESKTACRTFCLCNMKYRQRILELSQNL